MSANRAAAMTMTGWNGAMPVGRFSRSGFPGGAAVGSVAAVLFRIGEFFRAIRAKRPKLPPGSGGPVEPPDERTHDDPWDDPRNDPALWTLMMMH